jgi:hypothetical protein
LTPDVFKLAHVVLYFLAADDLIEMQAVDGHYYCKPVGLRQVVNVIGGHDRAGARHILDDKVWIAGNIFGEVTGKQPSPTIVKAAGRLADDDANCFAIVERFVLGTDGKRVSEK